jgi:epoxyqueuosine reductase
MAAGDQSSLLCRWAEEIGFDRVGIARLRPAEHGGHFLDWIARGKHAGMGYLARRVEVRLDPRALFLEARSALCVALHYQAEENESPGSGGLWSGVARYARGVDYHDLMGQRLSTLAKRIEAGFPGTVTRWYVDTGPVLERDLAAAAGLGAIGKNTCLLHPEAGSWFFLGEIFTSLDLPGTNAGIADPCGSCSRCLEACPTGALSREYELDANRCISYWTIEHRGIIPPAIRPMLGEWVFGCDICQEVCPHNDGAALLVDKAFELPEQRASLTLDSILSLDSENYRKLFRGSSMKRAKLVGLKRNAALAMGNSGDKRYVDSLLEALQNGKPELRAHAAWALGRIGGDSAASGLAQASSKEQDALVQEEISAARQSLESGS